ncbi:hypothetical protein CLOM_g18713 [Closterium sp. NIES-68]|nr:hypothetical protein CLOM_g18713 [Closterium sp. NIES-68]GJP81097.1 hypothetical protein CLOP_g11280 [Closterium sp. NIES-67]
MLWVDKHRPATLDKITVHRDTALQLKQLVQAGDCPHLLLFGPSGAGKKTLVLALLREMFGPGADKVKVENKPWKIEAGTRKLEVELTTVASNHHVELSPSDAGFQDRYVVQEVIKEMARNRPIDSKGNRSFKVLVLNEVDHLSREAQHALRRTMERYTAACRIVMCCSSASQVTEALRSRCLNLRIAAPSHDQIVDVLQEVASKEGVTLPPVLAGRVAVSSQRNLRKAILSLEAARAAHYPLSDNQPVQQNDWELCVAEIAADIISEQSPRRLFQIRAKFYDLLINCIPPHLIIKRLTVELMRKMDAELKHEVCHWAAFYEHRLHLGQKSIFHLEAFAAKVMAIYKEFLVTAFG